MLKMSYALQVVQVYLQRFRHNSLV